MGEQSEAEQGRCHHDTALRSTARSASKQANQGSPRRQRAAAGHHSPMAGLENTASASRAVARHCSITTQLAPPARVLSRPRVSCGRALSKEARKGPMRQLLRLGRRNLRRDRCPARPLKRLAGCFSAVALSHCNNRSLARILVVHPRIASAPNRVVLLPLSQRGGSGQCELSS